MAPATPRLLLVPALLLAAGVLLWVLHDPQPEPDAALDGAGTEEAAPAAQDAPGRPVRETPRDAGAPAAEDVPRVLPPDAAVEDLRDALTLQGEARTREAQAAYRALAHLAGEGEGVRAGFVRALGHVEDPVARGLVLAALGADRGRATRDLLVERLRAGTSQEERLGALLGLACGVSKLSVTASSLAGVRCPLGTWTVGPGTLPALAAFLDAAEGQAARDAVPVLATAVQRDVAVAALLVVLAEARPCRLYAALTPQERGDLRAAALAHDGLPGVTRRVLEATP